MPPAYKQVTVEWEGETYDITPTTRVGNQIDQHFCALGLLRDFLSGQQRRFQMAKVLWLSLRARGVNVKEDDVVAALSRELRAGAEAPLLDAAFNVLWSLGMFGDEGNGEPGPSGKTTKSQKGSPGGSSSRSQSGTAGSSQANSGE